MENNRRKLTLGIVKLDDENAYLQIIEQTHKEKDFSIFGNRYNTTKNITLSSSKHPTYNETYRILFTRGAISEWDNILIEIPYNHLQDVLEAIEEYNSTNGGIDNTFPQPGDTYYYIGGMGGVNKTHHNGSGIDEKFIEFGNCFQAEKLAETASEKNP